MSRYDQIIAALRARFEGILVAGGYRTDAGNNVTINDEVKTEAPQFPCIMIFPGESRDSLAGETPPSQGEENHYLPVEISALIEDDAAGSRGEALRQDLLKALKADIYFGGLAEGLSGDIISSAETTPAASVPGIKEKPPQGFIGKADLNFTIFYVTLFGEE